MIYLTSDLKKKEEDLKLNEEDLFNYNNEVKFDININNESKESKNNEDNNNNTDNDAKESDENTDEIINQLVDEKKK